MKTKILSLLLLAMALTAGAEAAKCYYCTQTDTAPWGCSKMTESRSGDSYYLNCSGSGETVCKFSDGTCPIVIKNSTIDEYIRDQVANNNFSGRVAYSMGYYTWTATDANNFSYIVFED